MPQYVAIFKSEIGQKSSRTLLAKNKDDAWNKAKSVAMQYYNKQCIKVTVVDVRRKPAPIRKAKQKRGMSAGEHIAQSIGMIPLFFG